MQNGSRAANALPTRSGLKRSSRNSCFRVPDSQKAQSSDCAFFFCPICGFPHFSLAKATALC